MAGIGYVIVIYATSGVMRAVLNGLKAATGTGFELFVIALCMLALGGLLFRFRASLRSLRLVPALGVAGVVGAYALVIMMLRIPEEQVHLLQYGLLSWLLTEGVWGRLPPRHAHLVVLCLVIAAGAGDELIQELRANRVGDLRDVGINAVAALLAQVLLALVLPTQPMAHRLRAY